MVICLTFGMEEDLTCFLMKACHYMCSLESFNENALAFREEINNMCLFLATDKR